MFVSLETTNRGVHAELNVSMFAKLTNKLEASCP